MLQHTNKIESSIKIAIDMMSGDNNLDTRFKAIQLAIKKTKNVNFLLVGDRFLIEKKCTQLSLKHQKRVFIIDAKSVVSMTDKPTIALKEKKDSSMWKALNCVATNTAFACVSSGNTGALIAMGKKVLGTFPSINRPAIVARIPNFYGQTLLLDAGANIECSPEQLLEFALMANQLTKKNKPAKIGLLNVGTEEIKGTSRIKNANKLLKECTQIQYIGYVEGNDIFNGSVDIVVCDGFNGNIVLKTSEGTVQLINTILQNIFNKNILNRMLKFIISPILTKLQSKIEPQKFNGARLLGLKGIVIKSHGSANQEGFYHAILCALKEKEQQLINNDT